MTGFGATSPLAAVAVKDRNPPGEAIRGSSSSSNALDPEPTAQTDPNPTFITTPPDEPRQRKADDEVSRAN
jgi:hypothetical protein